MFKVYLTDPAGAEPKLECYADAPDAPTAKSYVTPSLKPGQDAFCVELAEHETPVADLKILSAPKAFKADK